jgi:hypothetical protein
METGNGLNGRDSIPGRNMRLSLIISVQTGSAAHPAFYPTVTAGFIPGIKRPGLQADHSPPSSTGVKNVANIPQLPHKSPRHAIN